MRSAGKHWNQHIHTDKHMHVNTSEHHQLSTRWRSLFSYSTKIYYNLCVWKSYHFNHLCFNSSAHSLSPSLSPSSHLSSFITTGWSVHMRYKVCGMFAISTLTYNFHIVSYRYGLGWVLVFTLTFRWVYVCVCFFSLPFQHCYAPCMHHKVRLVTEIISKI